VQSSCAARVWPIEQMSSRSPSTRHQPHAPYRGRIDRAAAKGQFALRQQMLLEHVADGLDVEFRRQVHHGEIFVVENVLMVAAFSVSPFAR